MNMLHVLFFVMVGQSAMIICSDHNSGFNVRFNETIGGNSNAVSQDIKKNSKVVSVRYALWQLTNAANDFSVGDDSKVQKYITKLKKMVVDYQQVAGTAYSASLRDRETRNMFQVLESKL